MGMKAYRILLLSVILMALAGALLLTSFVVGPPVEAAGKSFTWSGFQWQVKTGRAKPGPNNWSEHNVWVDEKQQLHLRINKVSGHWYCAEVYTTKKLLYGKYHFSVEGRVDQLDPQVVFGLFHYPTPNVGPAGTNTIGIEFTRRGGPVAPIGNFVAYGRRPGEQRQEHAFRMFLKGSSTAHQYIWRPESIAFHSYELHHDQVDTLADWTTPEDFANCVCRLPMSVHLALWLYQGNAPDSGEPVEVVVKRFSYDAQR